MAFWQSVQGDDSDSTASGLMETCSRRTTFYQDLIAPNEGISTNSFSGE
jgi:hypothetical protein